MKIEDLLRELNIPFVQAGEHHHCRDGWLNLDCPNCSRGTQRWRLGYNLKYGHLNCWHCGRLKLLDVLYRITGRHYDDLLRMVKDLPRRRKVLDDKPVDRNRALVMPAGVEGLSKLYKDYLETRRVDPLEMVRLWGLQGIAPGYSLAWRVYIPIVASGEVVSWTTRTIGNQQPRYISASPHQEILDHKKLLYGEDYCRNAIIVCEGPVDVWRVGPGAVATFGTGFSRSQVRKISKYSTRVICFDSDPLAQLEACKLCDILEGFPGDTYNVRLSSKDAGDATDKEIKALRRKFFGDV